jgi:hypothetical protein
MQFHITDPRFSKSPRLHAPFEEMSFSALCLTADQKYRVALRTCLPIGPIQGVEPFGGLAALCRAVAEKACMRKLFARDKTSFLRQGWPLEET